MSEEKPKKRSPIHEYFYDKKTPEEIAAWRKAAMEKSKATRARKRNVILDAEMKAQELLPQILAEDILLLESDAYTPRPEILERIRAILSIPTMTLDRLRHEQFKSMSEKGWEKLTKFLFKDHVTNEQHLGLQIIEQRDASIRVLRQRIRMIVKEIKLAKREAKASGKSLRAPVALLELLMQAEKELRDYMADSNKNLFRTNLETNKVKGSTSINIHTTIPRPEPKDVTPKKQNLDQLINGD